MKATAQLQSVSYRETRAYLLALAFAVGNILLPQLCHLVPRGGLMFLPIYFFTLVAAYRYGLTVGMLTAILSPVANSLLFGMPSAVVLPGILVKSVALAVLAAMMAKRVGKATLPALIAVVLGYQLIGSLFESVWYGSLATGFVDFRLGIPGLLLQIFGGLFLIRRL